LRRKIAIVCRFVRLVYQPAISGLRPVGNNAIGDFRQNRRSLRVGVVIGVRDVRACGSTDQ